MDMEKKTDNKRAAFDWLDAMMTALVVIILAFTFAVKLYTVNGSSMQPTLQSGAKILISSFYYTPRRDDIVVVDKSIGYGESLVKRIIATENQTVNITDDGCLYVDGVLIDRLAGNVQGDLTYPITVPEGYCFLMGDNRGGSYDSRYVEIGFIKNTHIMGKVLLIVSGKGEL